MKKILLVGISLLFVISVQAVDLSEEEQLRIIRDYMHVTGQLDISNASVFETIESDLPVKCGTPAVAQFQDNYDKLDKALLKSLGGLVLPERPDFLTDTLDSPSGFFRLYYTTTGQDAIYDGIPGYIDSVAAILDNVYDHIVNELGYPAPPSDGFYNGGGDGKYDIYIFNISANVYALTYKDSMSIDNTLLATSFMELENDFQEIDAYVVSDDPYRPLDAARVTIAHEFFHFVHFGIDHTETQQVLPKVIGSAWLEMSATWMEEEIYDDVNDYYLYLPSFFAAPFSSLQQFGTESDLHPYASVIYPIFLTEKYNRDVIKEIWLKCGQKGTGPDFLEAMEEVIDSVGTNENFALTFNEFALWNYFTGSRADQAPDGWGYEERAFYDEFRSNAADSEIFIVDNYVNTNITLFDQNYLNPFHNGAFYMELRELQTIAYDTTFWNCNTGSFPSCTDSTQVIDTTLGFDLMHIDSSLMVQFGLDSAFHHHWGVGIIFQFEEDLDSTEITYGFLVPQLGQLTVLEIPNPRLYRKVTIVLTPASSIYTDYLTVPPAQGVDPRYEILFVIPSEKFVIDSALVNLPAAILNPYPNPAVVFNMTEPIVNFRLQVPTDSLTLPLYGELYSGTSPYLVVDLFTVAGEKVATTDQLLEIDERLGSYVVSWDMKNDAGKDVSSGVYIAYARMFSQEKKGELILETTTKVAIIR